MRKFFVSFSAALIASVCFAGCSSAPARLEVAGKTGGTRTLASGTQRLSGAAAEDFVDKHFPNADIPGPVEGKFKYVIGKKTGYAKCFVPAMGERSDGVESTCSVTEGARQQKISGVAAEDFVDKHFPNADIPGPAEGRFTYSSGAMGTGYAKCFVPAMGGRSDGVESSCDVSYN